MNIKGKLVTLRAIELSDEKLLRDMLNDPYIEKMVVGWAYPVSKLQQENYIGKYLREGYGGGVLRLIIEDNNCNAIGTIILHDIDEKNGTASIGIKIMGNENRGKGLGSDSIMSLLRYAFDELRLNRVSATFLDYNIPSQTAFKRCGFQLEGRMRQHIYKNGKFHDLLFAGILREEYYELIEKNHCLNFDYTNND